MAFLLFHSNPVKRIKQSKLYFFIRQAAYIDLPYPVFTLLRIEINLVGFCFELLTVNCLLTLV